MTFLHWAIISPFLLAILIPFFYRYIPKIHTGWFVFILPLACLGIFCSRWYRLLPKEVSLKPLHLGAVASDFLYRLS